MMVNEHGQQPATLHHVTIAVAQVRNYTDTSLALLHQQVMASQVEGKRSDARAHRLKFTFHTVTFSFGIVITVACGLSAFWPAVIVGVPAFVVEAIDWKWGF